MYVCIYMYIYIISHLLNNESKSLINKNKK